METPKYLQVLWNYKWLLLFGVVVAAVAAVFAGFTYVNGQLVPRAAQTWSASTEMLVTSDSAALFQAEVPGVPVQPGVTEPQFAKLSENALIYAYILAGDEIQEKVEASVGTLDPLTESITSLRRTTQPAGDERFPGRYELPVLEAVGTAATSARAEEISKAAAAAFVLYLTAQQDQQAARPLPAGTARHARRQSGGRGRLQQPGDPGRGHLPRSVPRVRGPGVRHRRHPFGVRQAQGGQGECPGGRK